MLRDVAFRIRTCTGDARMSWESLSQFNSMFLRCVAIKIAVFVKTE
jgi:hypothetical protein